MIISFPVDLALRDERVSSLAQELNAGQEPSISALETCLSTPNLAAETQVLLVKVLYAVKDGSLNQDMREYLGGVLRANRYSYGLQGLSGKRVA